jgi:hypothetical protein
MARTVVLLHAQSSIAKAVSAFDQNSGAAVKPLTLHADRSEMPQKNKSSDGGAQMVRAGEAANVRQHRN